MFRIPTRLLAIMGLVLGGIAVGLAAAEVAARLVWQPPPRLPRPRPPADLPTLETAEQLARPHVRGVYNGVVFETNAAGFRGRDYAVPKPANVYRIAVAGDSVTMGSGVLAEEAYPALLERALAERHHDLRFEVLNLGLIGLDIRQVIARLILVGLPFQPDLIVYGCTLNDINGPHYRHSMAPLGHLVKRERYNRYLESRSYLLRVVWPAWVSLTELIAPQPGSLLFEQLDNYLNNPPAWEDFSTGLAWLAAVADQQHVPAVVFIHTNLEYLTAFHPERRIYARIAAAAEARGLATIDAFPFLRGHDAESLWLSPVDGHPNRLGHALLARALLDGLERLHPWRPHGPRGGDP